MKTFSLALLVLLMVPSVAAQQTATYRVSFESTWSANTHPDGFPSNPHFSGLIGATHDATVTVWEAGGLATPGIEVMAETGSKSTLTTELRLHQQMGHAGVLLDGGGIGRSPGSVDLLFDISTDHPLVTLVSMLAPSPDWFVGVGGMPLFVEGAWIDRAEVELYVYDAGTDSGATYTAANADTNPQDAIARIEEAPFLVNNAVPPIGRYIFERISPVGVEGTPPEVPQTHTLMPPAPNPFSHTTNFSLAVAQAQHVRVDLFDVRGRRLQRLFAGSMGAGSPHRLAVEGARLPPGVYFLHITAETFRDGHFIVRL